MGTAKNFPLSLFCTSTHRFVPFLSSVSISKSNTFDLKNGEVLARVETTYGEEGHS